MSKDYEITVRVRNNRFLAKMREMGFETIADMSRASGIAQTQLGVIANMTKAAVQAGDKGWRVIVIRTSEFLRCLPEDIIPVAQREAPMRKRTASFTVDAGDVEQLTASLRSVAALPYDDLLRREALGQLNDALLRRLSPREQRVVSLLFGLDGGGERTLAQIAEQFDVGSERVRQIELRALRKLRHPVSKLVGVYETILGVDIARREPSSRPTHYHSSFETEEEIAARLQAKAEQAQARAAARVAAVQARAAASGGGRGDVDHAPPRPEPPPQSDYVTPASILRTIRAQLVEDDDWRKHLRDAGPPPYAIQHPADKALFRSQVTGEWSATDYPVTIGWGWALVRQDDGALISVSRVASERRAARANEVGHV